MSKGACSLTDKNLLCRTLLFINIYSRAPVFVIEDLDKFASVAQRIEHLSSEQGMRVRFPPDALANLSYYIVEVRVLPGALTTIYYLLTSYE